MSDSATTDSAEELLREPGAWYDVTRRGISDTPVRMRFGRCVWQRTDPLPMRSPEKSLTDG